MKKRISFYQVSGVGTQADSRTNEKEIDFLDVERFAKLLAENNPTSYYNIGSADGAPRNGLIAGRKRMVVYGEEREYIVAQEHIGHGCFAPVAVLDV